MGGLTVALLIFFGAWAVSSSEAGAGGALTSALTGANANPAAADAGPASGGANANPFQVASLDETGEPAAEESWWGQAFLKACPLH